MSRRSHLGQLADSSWNPGQYLRFEDHRLRPACELLERISLAAPRLVHDLGCGAGNVTRLLAERWPTASVVGLDHSAEMLARAAAEPVAATWCQGRIEDWQPAEPPDLVYSNAALHWVDGHEHLFPRLMQSLAPGGCLAVQMPLSFDLPSHRSMREVLESGGKGGAPFGDQALREAVGRRWVLEPVAYYEFLAEHAAQVDVWSTEYLQVLAGEDPVLEWIKGTSLRPVLKALAEDERESFLAELGARLREAYPQRADGRTLYTFRRLFLVAQ